MSLKDSDLPFLFVLYMTTANQEVICVNNNGLISLPRYEFDAVYGSEAITTAIARQMEVSMGFSGIDGKISLADTEYHYEHEPEKEASLVALYDEDEDDDAPLTEMMYGINPKKTPAEIAIENDSPFRVCVAHDCIPCEKIPEDSTSSPYVKWARELFTYQLFPEWDKERKDRITQEKKIILIPINRWNDMILSREITDTVSIMATKIAHAWIAQPKAISTPRKTKK